MVISTKLRTCWIWSTSSAPYQANSANEYTTNGTWSNSNMFTVLSASIKEKTLPTGPEKADFTFDLSSKKKIAKFSHFILETSWIHWLLSISLPNSTWRPPHFIHTIDTDSNGGREQAQSRWNLMSWTRRERELSFSEEREEVSEEGWDRERRRDGASTRM